MKKVSRDKGMDLENRLRNLAVSCILAVQLMPTKLIRKQFLLSAEENKMLESEASKKGLSVSNLTRTLHGLEPLKAGGGRKQKYSLTKKKKNAIANEK